MTTNLSCRQAVPVRFNEVDSMDVVWHGHYVQYLEEGREAFGRKYGIDYMTFREAGYLVPIVTVELSYKKSLVYGDTVTVETRYVPASPGKIEFSYILRNQHGDVVSTARTVQVFLDSSRTLQWLEPQVYARWKQKWLPEPALV